MRLSPAAIFLVLALPLSAQSQPASSAPAQIATPRPPLAEPAPAPVSATPTPQVKPRVRLQTTFGPIVLELEPAITPKTVENFLTYVKDGFYSGTIFHRVIKGSVIQGGGLKEDMTEKPTRLPIFNEARLALAAGLKNTTGTLAMARSENPHSGAAQFFINVEDNPAFDPHGSTAEGYGYCVFGRVVEGMETVAKIEKVQTVWRKGQPCVPEYPVRLKSAEILPATTPESTPAPALPQTPAPIPPADKPKP